MEGTFTCHTFPHVSSHDLVVRTGTGVFRRVLIDLRRREAKKLTTSIYAISLAAPVGT